MQQQQQHGDEDSSETDYFNLRASVWDAPVGSTATLVAIRLVDNWPRVWPSLAFICRKTKLSERAVRYALRELERAGVITVENRGSNKSRRYWFLDENGGQILVPRVGRRRPTPDGGTASQPPTVDPDDSEPESGPIVSTQQRQHVQEVPRNARKMGGQVVPLQGGHHVPLRGQVVPLQGGHHVPPKEITSSKEIKKGGERARAAARASSGRKRPSPPPLCTSWDGWTLSATLRAELVALGVKPARIDQRVRALRNRPGCLGKGVASLDDYIREQAEARWVLWDAQDAVSSGGTRARSSFPSVRDTSSGGGGSKAKEAVPGCPAWVYPQHAKFAERNALDLKRAVLVFSKEQRTEPGGPPCNRPACDVFSPFMKFLEALARKTAKKARAA